MNRRMPVLSCLLVLSAATLCTPGCRGGAAADRATTYAPGFSYSKFDKVRIGMTRDEVIELLGEPLFSRFRRLSTTEFYVRQGAQLVVGPGDDVSTDPADYTAVLYHPVSSVVSGLYGRFLDIGEIDLGTPKSVVRERLGEPNVIITVGWRAEILIYSARAAAPRSVEGRIVSVEIGADGRVCDYGARYDTE
jgi:hypothetical protein